MPIRKTALAIGAASLVCLQTAAFAAPAPVSAQHDEGVSVGAHSMVKIVRHTNKAKDPVTKYGAGFFIVVFNKGEQPIVVGPEAIQIRDRDGHFHPLMTVERLAQLKQQEADRAQAMGTMFAVGMSMMGGAAAGRMQNNPAAANQMMAMTQTSAMAMLVMSENHAAAIASEQDALVAAYVATPFNQGQVAPLSAASGRVVVDGLKDRDPAAVLVTVGDETHEIDFLPAGR